ncbi:SLBB domain-containing protein [Mucilaginibacter ximonensis]|uniref:SLBB domain-containing protein n=1 Tax=Mucilaginibacter ximonensis TaxID=538021 RepID=A0ABW5YEY4_9SPHI
MKIKYLFFILFLPCFFLSQNAVAQKLSLSDISSIKPGQLTDDQIIQYWERAQEAGLSEKDVYDALEKKGVSADDIAMLKQRVSLLGLSDKTSQKKTATKSEKSADFTRAPNDTIVKPEPQKKRLPSDAQTLEVYGMNFFTQNRLSFRPNFSIATPKNYVLGPGDQVIVILTGLNETTLQPKVTGEGNILLPYAGLIYVNGFTIEQATSLIKAKMSKVYPALKSGQTQLAVNLGTTRSIHVTVNGEVVMPGNFTVSGFTTLFNILYNAGGPNENGSLRHIELIRNNKIYKTVDFYSFLQSGLQDENIRLEDQDIIHVPIYKKHVGITGEVKNPFLFELKNDETLQDLINYAGGFTALAYKGVAKVDQITDLQHEVKDVSANMFANYVPQNGDLVTIGAVTNRYTNRIFLSGSVFRPGAYELKTGYTLNQLLKDAQGLRPEAYMERGYINRTLPNLEKQIISFKPGDIIAGKNDIPLLREDSVVVLDRTLFASMQKVSVGGYVKKPVSFIYRDGLNLGDALAMAGGFADEAAQHHVEISRIINNKSDSVANQLVNTFVVDMTNEANQDLKLEPMDIINVPRLVNYRPLGNVIVKGEVAFPGNYPVQKRDETALEFLSRAGGVTPYGSIENTQIYRNGVRVNLDLSQTRKSSASDHNKMILLPGDSVYVPRVISYVEVSGAVNNPQYITFKARRFKYYINAAAGTKQNARLAGAYIQYPDGLNQPVRHFLFFRLYPIVKPGSRIVVPEKQIDGRFKIGISEIGGLATALTAIVSIIAILHK